MAFKIKVPTTVAELQHKGEHFFHASYLGAVSWEAHGWYQIMAAILLGVTLIGTVIQSAEH